MTNDPEDSECSLEEWIQEHPFDDTVRNSCVAHDQLLVAARLMRDIAAAVEQKHGLGVQRLENCLLAENIRIGKSVKLLDDEDVSEHKEEEEEEIQNDLVLLGNLFKRILAPEEMPLLLKRLVNDLTCRNKSPAIAPQYKSASQVKDDLNQVLQNPVRLLSDQDYIVNFTRELATPARIHGRGQAMAELMEAYQRVASQQSTRSEMVLVAGRSGTGKSCLVLQACKHFVTTKPKVRFSIADLADAREQAAQRQGGYFCCGKFDQLRASQPYSALIGAFTDLCDQILALDQAGMIKTRLKESVGSQGRVLTEVIPNLEKLLNHQENVVQLGGNEARNRFNFVFRRFARAIAVPGHPLVLFLDDLQWADEASLDLIKTLVTDFGNPSILVICAFRNDEVTETHPFSMQLREIDRRLVPITKIQVDNLSREVLNDFIADLLYLPRRLVRNLTDIVYRKTQGNALFAAKYLKYLRDNDLLTFNVASLQWEWDEQAINSEQSADNIVDLLASKILQLPQETQDVLKMAAGIGTYFDDYTLKLIFRSALVDKNVLLRSTFSGLSNTLKMATDEGLIKPWGKIGYKFVHDKITDAAYSLIPQEERAALHLKIGRLLSRNAAKPLSRTKSGRKFTPKKWTLVTSEDMGRFVDRMLFVSVDQLNRGSDCIVDKKEKIQLARLNLKAGERAIQSSAFVQAEQYLNAGLKQIEDRPWQEHYDLIAKLYSALAETKYCNGTFDEAKMLFTQVVSNATRLLDKLRVYSVYIKSLGAQSKVQEAIDVGFDVLAQLGEPFPDKVNNMMILGDLLKTKRMLTGRTDDSLRNMTEMQDELKVAAMQVLCSMLSFTYMCRPEYVPLVAGRLMQLTLRHGACNESAFAFSTYALILSGVLNDYVGGHRFAQLALFLIERFNAREWFAHVYGVVYSRCIHWRQHARLCIDPLLMAHRVGMAAGDIEYACWCAYFFCKHKFFCGQPLGLLENDMRGYCKLMADQGQETPLKSLSTYWQAVLNLLGRCDNPLELSGEAMVQDKVLEEAREMGNSFLLQCVYLHVLWLAYILGEYQLAAEMAEKSRNVKDVSPGVYEVIEQAFYDGLASSALALEHPSEKKWRSNALKAKAKLKKWAKSTPDNCLHKYLLLKAESASTHGQGVKVTRIYQTAVALAAKTGFVQDEAIAYERFGEFCLRSGDSVEAAEYFARAHKLYGTWGAVVKADKLDRRFPTLADARSGDSFSSFLQDISFRKPEDDEYSFLEE